MKLHTLSPAEGSTKEKFRKGRGAGSGNGKTAGKGHKGQNARSGGGVRPGFEGGQLPLYRQLPKRGFNNFRFGKVYDGLKVLGDGEISKALTVKAALFSATAKEKIEAAGGKAEVI